MARRVRRQKLTSLSDIYKFFRHNQTPIYFLSPTPYNLLGLGRWINKFEYINFFDSFDGTHPRSRCRASTDRMNSARSRM